MWTFLPFWLSKFHDELGSHNICDSFSSFKGVMRTTMILPDIVRGEVSSEHLEAYLSARRGFNQQEKVIEPLLTEVREMVAGVAIQRGGEALKGHELVEAYDTALVKVTQGVAELTRYAEVVLLCFARMMDDTADVYILV